jgi:hypothetical protein
MKHPAAIACIVVLTCVLPACTPVKLTPEAEKKARVLDPEDVSRCQRIGRTTVAVQDRFLGIPLAPNKLSRELRILARNSAVSMGGDTAVPVTEVNGGEQTFAVYKCLP